MSITFTQINSNDVPAPVKQPRTSEYARTVSAALTAANAPEPQVLSIPYTSKKQYNNLRYGLRQAALKAQLEAVFTVLPDVLYFTVKPVQQPVAEQKEQKTPANVKKIRKAA